MTTINTTIERLTHYQDDQQRPLIFSLQPGGLIEIRPKNTRGVSRKTTVGELWIALGVRNAEGRQHIIAHREPATRAEVLRDIRTKLHTLPRRDTTYKVGVGLIDQALEALEELERYLNDNDPES